MRNKVFNTIVTESLYIKVGLHKREIIINSHKNLCLLHY